MEEASSSLGDSASKDVWARRTAIFKNAERLFLVSKLLSENGRYPSAYSIAMLALEELGKLLLDIWSTSDNNSKGKPQPTLHRRKQSAVASLLLANYLVKTYGKKIIAEGISEDLVETVAKELAEGPAGKFAFHVNIGVFDKIKQIGLYHDCDLAERGLHAGRLDKGAVSDICDKCQEATQALDHPDVVDIGAGIYRLYNV